VSSNPLRDLFSGFLKGRASFAQAVVPRHTFADVILPPRTRRSLEEALDQVRNHHLIFREWGLGERHASGLGLAFNFAGPPGTGKTICAEAIAFELGKGLLLVRYDELVSMWVGQTGKNLSQLFEAAAEHDAVLFFDEADALAGRRFSGVADGYQREANSIVNVLFRELEQFNGVIIFATNLASNFDPAFERRIRSHILFEMPGMVEREEIWRVQLHRRTPLAEDVNFRALAEEFPVAGGDIKNAVLKAAALAAGEKLPDPRKRIRQQHFVQAMQDVQAAKRVMQQSLFAPAGPVVTTAAQIDPLARITDDVGRAVRVTVWIAAGALVFSLAALLIALVR
jgi:SpoVK/Ycf46/Vps4 family AAA+-type ATPase